MTIVLQHQFWDLEVYDDRFAVTLSFNEVSQRLDIPFAAVKVFADPSVEFGLQFTRAGARRRRGAAIPVRSGDATPGAGLDREAAERRGRARSGRPGSAPTSARGSAAVDEAARAAAEAAEEGQAGGADKIVTLDRFRKK